MNLKRCLFLLIITALTISACKKAAVTPGNPIIPIPPTAKMDTDVYVVGDIATKNGKQIAVYWKNGVLTKLTDSLQSSFGYAIAINGNDIYVSGTVDDENYKTTAVYWKNGVMNMLSASLLDGSVTRGIVVNGNDVYVAGIIRGTQGGLYWKNGVPVAATGNTNNIVASSIALSQNDVFIAGWSVLSDNHTLAATYWKNGSQIVLANTYSNAYGIAVDGSNVYVAGANIYSSGSSNAIYWKNGSPILLSSSYSGATGIATNGNDIYVSGFNGVDITSPTAATYWKNGVANEMTNGSLSSYGSSLVLNGSDIYMAGRQEIAANGAYRPLYWKNNTPVLLPYYYVGEAVGIAVVLHPHN